MYTIRREEQFEQQFALIAKDFERVADIESSIDWFLSRSCTNLKYVSQLDQAGYYLWRQELVHSDFPQLLILYKVDHSAEMILLLAVKRLDN